MNDAALARWVKAQLEALPAGGRLKRDDLAWRLAGKFGDNFPAASRMVRAGLGYLQRAGVPAVSDGQGFYITDRPDVAWKAAQVLIKGAMTQLDRAAGLLGLSLVHLLRNVMGFADAADKRRERARQVGLFGEAKR
jgi:hypothetical protein